MRKEEYKTKKLLNNNTFDKNFINNSTYKCSLKKKNCLCLKINWSIFSKKKKQKKKHFWTFSIFYFYFFHTFEFQLIFDVFVRNEKCEERYSWWIEWHFQIKKKKKDMLRSEINSFNWKHCSNVFRLDYYYYNFFYYLNKNDDKKNKKKNYIMLIFSFLLHKKICVVILYLIIE